MKLLTNLLFEPKGRHDSSLAYSIKDTVMSPDGSRVYFALQDVPAGIALTNEDYWILQMDLSASKAAMDEAVANFADYARQVGTKVRGETGKTTGNPVTFLPDAGSLLQPITVLEPKQEGSGDPAPGGKNLLPRLTPGSRTVNGVTFTANADNSVSVKGTATARAVYQLVAYTDAFVLPVDTYTISTGTPLPSSGVSLTCEYYNGASWGGQYGKVNGNNDKITVSNVVANTNFSMYISIADGVTVDFTVYPQIETGSEATSYSPPANIRPITGYDKLELNAAGKNLCPLIPDGITTVNGITWTAKDGIITANGTATAQTIFEIAVQSDPAKHLKLTTGQYFLNGCPANGAYETYSINLTSYNFQSENGYHIDSGNGVRCDVKKEDEIYIVCRIQAGVTANNLTFKPMLVAGTSAGEFAPTQGYDPYTVSLGETVYGGRFEWLTGGLAKEYGQVSVDGTASLFELVVRENTVRVVYYLPQNAADAAEMQKVVSDTLPFKLYVWSNDQIGTYILVGYPTSLVLSLPRSVYGDTLETIKAQLAERPIQVAYKLASPVQTQLTPHVISAVDPEQTNTLYGDGTIEVEYVKPLHVSIEERVAAIASAMLMKEE